MPELLEGSAAALPLEDESVDLVVTSPPYNAGMPYNGVSDELSERDYLHLVRKASDEIGRVLKFGGRAFVNVPAAMPGPEGERVNHASIWWGALKCGGLRYRDTIVWLQSAHSAGCAWGSFGSPNAPNFRGGHESILVFYKGRWSRGRNGRNDITNEDFVLYSRNVWEMREASRKGHPAPFPAELPKRAILMSTWPGDTVLDPFAGSFTTVKVAEELGRHGIGVDASQAYVEEAREYFGLLQ